MLKFMLEFMPKLIQKKIAATLFAGFLMASLTGCVHQVYPSPIPVKVVMDKK